MVSEICLVFVQVFPVLVLAAEHPFWDLSAPFAEQLLKDGDFTNPYQNNWMRFIFRNKWICDIQISPVCHLWSILHQHVGAWSHEHVACSEVVEIINQYPICSFSQVCKKEENIDLFSHLWGIKQNMCRFTPSAVSHFVGTFCGLWRSNFRMKVKEKSYSCWRSRKGFFLLFLLKVWKTRSYIFQIMDVSLCHWSLLLESDEALCGFFFSSGQEPSTRWPCLGCLKGERVCRWRERKRQPSLTILSPLLLILLVKADNSSTLQPDLL